MIFPVTGERPLHAGPTGDIVFSDDLGLLTRLTPAVVRDRTYYTLSQLPSYCDHQQTQKIMRTIKAIKGWNQKSDNL